MSVQYKNVRIACSKSMKIFIREKDLVTDKGFIFEDTYTDSSYSYDYSDSDDADPSSDSLMDINLMVANHKLIYRRKYIKIQTILANLGGLFKALSLAFYFLSFFFSIVKMNLKIVNKIFDFEIESNIKNQKLVINKHRINNKLYNKEYDLNNCSDKNSTHKKF